MDNLKKYVEFDFEKMDKIKLGYYLIGFFGLILPLFKVVETTFGLSQGFSGFTVMSGSGIFGYAYMVGMLFGLATLCVNAIKKYEDIAFKALPIAAIVIIVLVQISTNGQLAAMGVGSYAKVSGSIGFWVILLVSAGAIAYQWYPVFVAKNNKTEA